MPKPPLLRPKQYATADHADVYDSDYVSTPNAGHSPWLWALNATQVPIVLTALVFLLIVFFDLVRYDNFFVNAWAIVLWQALLLGFTTITAVAALLMAPWSPVATFYHPKNSWQDNHHYDMQNMRLFGVNMAQWVLAVAGFFAEIYVIYMGRVEDFVSDGTAYNLVWATAGGSFEDAYPILFIHGTKLVLSIFSVVIISMAFLAPVSWMSLVDHMRQCYHKD